MLPSEKTLYWFTPFFRRSDLADFFSQCRQGNQTAFFCYDSHWNRAGMDELQHLKHELNKYGVQLIMIEGRVEKTVPSVARVLKAGRVVYSKPQNQKEFETVMRKICKDLELHSITICDYQPDHFPFFRNSDHASLKRAV